LRGSVGACTHKHGVVAGPPASFQGFMRMNFFKSNIHHISINHLYSSSCPALFPPPLPIDCAGCFRPRLPAGVFFCLFCFVEVNLRNHRQMIRAYKGHGVKVIHRQIACRQNMIQLPLRTPAWKGAWMIMCVFQRGMR